MRLVRGCEPSVRAPRAAARRAQPGGPRPRSAFVAAIEGSHLAEELRRLLVELAAPADLEIIPQDGPLTLARLRTSRPRLAFVSMDLRLMEGLTLLRALPASRARQVVLLVPDTLEGYRRAWDGLYLGARDVLVTRGAPPQRFKGPSAARLRQLAHLLDLGSQARGPDAVPGFEGAWEAVPTAGAREPRPEERDPWVVLAESRHLPVAAAWLRRVEPEAPVLLRVPEGPRFAGVVRDGLGRLLTRPVRMIGDGDRLVPGHVHLLHDGCNQWIENHGGFPLLREKPLSDPPGGLCAQLSLLQCLGSSSAALRVVLPEADLFDREEFLAAGQGRHALFHLVPTRQEGAGAGEDGKDDDASQLAA